MVELGKVGSRTLSTPLVVSAAVHAAVLGWIASETEVGRKLLRGQEDKLVLTEVELIPAEVELIPPVRQEPTPRPAAAAVPEPLPDPQTERKPVPEPLPRPTSETAPLHDSQSLAMRTDSGGSTAGELTTAPGEARSPGETDRGVTPPTPREIAGSIAPILGPPPPPSPLAPPRPRKPPRERSEIVPDGKGGYVGGESVFVARVGRDGRVQFEDKPNFHMHLALPGARDIGHGLESWYADPKGHATRDTRAVETHTVTILSGGFDLTDWAMRAAGGDPYSFRKAAFLDRTREERAQMSVTEERENLRDSLAALPEFLARVWAYEPWTKAKRRQALFELWDECAERGSPGVLTAAKSARATIVAFIRRELPEGHDDAFTGEELRKLNAGRQSSMQFAPYE